MAPLAPNFVSIDTFLEEQQQQLSQASKSFEQIVDKLQALVEKVCKDVTSRATVSEGINNPFAVGGGDGDEADGARTLPKKHRTKSMAAEREEHEERVRAVKQAQDEAKTLGDFVRLTDYMTVSACFLLNVSTTERCLEVWLAPLDPLRAPLALPCLGVRGCACCRAAWVRS